MTMFRFTIRDVLWLTVVVWCGCSRSQQTTLNASDAGRRLLAQLEKTEAVIVVANFEGRSISCELISTEDRQQFADWLSKGVEDKKAVDYPRFATLRLLPSGSAWHVLIVDKNEFGLRDDSAELWRGLNRAKFTQLVLMRNSQPTPIPRKIDP